VTYYTWDYRNRLTEVKVEDKNGTVLNDEKFTYDVFNNRIGVLLNGTQQLYTVYDGANPYMDFNGSGTLTQRYLTNPNALSQYYGQVNASGVTQWFLTDNLGSIRQVISTSGSSLDAITYDPYGNILNQTNAANAPRMMFAGGIYDPITGTYRFGPRQEDPLAGRWDSPDSSGLGPDSNPYRYAYNAPSYRNDPSGLQPSLDSPEQQAIFAQYALAGNLTLMSDPFFQEEYSGEGSGGISNDWFAKMANGGAGWGDAVSLGATRRIRQAGGFDAVDYNSAAYGYGQIGGEINNAALMFANPCALSGGFATGLRAINGIQAVGGMYNARDNINQKNYGAAAFDLLGVAGNMSALSRACFAAGTPLLTPDGDKPIEQFKVGDWVLSAPEFDPEAPPEPRRVEEVFRNTALLLNMKVGGRTIQTTSEHPFYVREKGWTAARDLRVGDLLWSHKKNWAVIDALEGTDTYATVYNLRIADYHTYFVGRQDWEFSVWAHNAYKVPNEIRRNAVAEAWRMEAELVRRTGRGTRNWTTAQIQELLATGRVRRYDGHHINSVSQSPLLAGLPDNIEFVTRFQHLRRHFGNWRNPTFGNLLNRG
jgi:RHS repeat-associated protein